MRCPSAQKLEDFLEERCGDADQAAIGRHVDRCTQCQAKLEELTGEVATASSAVLRQPVSTLAAATSSTDFLLRLKDHPPSSSNLSGNGSRSRSGQFQDKAGFSFSGKIPVVANYEIISELGRGGMGVVYKARQIGLDRLVALKMILAGPHAGPKDLGRFRQEAEAVARLCHPNIIQVYDIGESESRPFLALEFVEGDSLAHLLKGVPQPLHSAARLVETLAKAIHYAHQRDIVHRDLKPANILLERVASKSAAGDQWPETSDKTEESSPAADTWSLANSSLAACPKITDFGLAKRLDDRGMGTQSGDIIGTPSYMAPEQAGSKGVAVGPATDVYALGAILYELLTGRPPFRGPTSLDTVLLVLHEDPVRPSFLRRDLPRDLETITLKCLAKDPAKRYASAEALADDLNRYRKGKPIKARPVGLYERIWKWSRHRPMTASLVAGMFLVGLLGFAGVTWQWQEAEYERMEADEARINAEVQRKKASAALYFSRISQSQLHWRVHDFTSAKYALDNCLPVELRGWEWRYLQGLFHNDLFTLAHTRGGQGGGVAFDADGTRIASVVSGPTMGETTWPSEVWIWDAVNGDHRLTGPTTLHRLAFSPNGQRLALATTDGDVMIWDPLTGREILQKKLHQGSVMALAFSPDGKMVVSGGADKKVRIWDAASGEVLRVFSGHTQMIQSVAFHPSRPMVASAGRDSTVRIWDIDAPEGTSPKILSGHHKIAVYCVAFNPNGQTVVSAGGNGNLKIWNLATGEIVQSLTGDAGAVLSIAFSPDGRYLAKAGKDGTVRIWHLSTGVERMSFRGHTTQVEGIHFSPDCRRVVSISPGEGVVKVWDFTRHPEFATFARMDAHIEALSFSEEGNRLLSLTTAGKLQLWDGSSGMLLEERVLPMSKEIASPGVPASFSGEGKFLAARSELDLRIVKTWNTASGQETMAFQGHALPVSCVRISQDGRLLATCASSAPLSQPSGPGGRHGEPEVTNEIKVWDVASGKLLKSLARKGRIFNVAFSPDGQFLALGGQDGAVTLLDWNAGRQEVRIIGHRGDVTGLVFSSDGRLLSSAGLEDRTVRIWNVETLLSGKTQAVHTLAAPRLILDLAFTADGSRLAAISRDMVKMWDVEGGHEVLTLRGAAQRYGEPSFNPRLAFSPDGTQLAGTNWDMSISTWEAMPLNGADPLEKFDEQFARFQEKRRKFADERASFWHLQEAELCLEYKNYPATVFHLKRVRGETLTEPLKLRWKGVTDRYQAAVAKKLETAEKR